MQEIEKGFYYHYKYNPAGLKYNYTYEVVGIARHTEIEEIPRGVLVIYRALYDSSYYENEKYFGARPYEMFAGDVTKDGKTFPRFTKITDPAVIAELEKIRDEMYP